MATLDQRHVALAERLRHSGNLSSLAITLLLSIVLVTAGTRGQLTIDNLRALAFCNAVAYALAHAARRFRQARLEQRSDEPAQIARLVYRSPARITDLDLAAYWGAFAVLAPALISPS